MKAKYCSPGNENNFFTCFSNNSLVKIAKEFNKEHNNKINIPKNIDNHKRKKLWEDIQVAMKAYTPCDNDYCLLETDVIKNIDDREIKFQTFRPKMPETWNSNMTTWLSTIDIGNVMKQYEQKHKDFVFIGPVPIDFDLRIGFGMCISNELCDINLKNLIKKGKSKLGVVFNLDPHNRGGSHWVALYTDLYKGGIYFFDSYALKPKPEIYELMKRLKEQGNNLLINKDIKLKDFNDENEETLDAKVINEYTLNVNNSKNLYNGNLIYINNKPNLIKEVSNNIVKLKDKINKKDINNVTHKSFRLYYNTNRFQYKNTECGVYSMHFIEQFLNGKNFDEITNDIYSDEEINKKRQFYYRPNKFV